MAGDVEAALQTRSDGVLSPAVSAWTRLNSIYRSEDSINTYSYKDAGVDVEKASELVEAIKPLAASTRRPGAGAGLGGFAGFFDLRAAGYEDALLVASTDGVGTKLKVAIASGRHRSVGIDLVAMCVNDLVVVGAEPLFFLDYFASASLDRDTVKAVIEGIAEGCRMANCALIGGETAELPGMYAKGDYDLAGFAVGAVSRPLVLPTDDIREGDVLLGLSSSGLHSNGYSLVRAVVEKAGLSYDQPAPFANDQSLGEALLTPTKIYISQCLPAVRGGLLKGLCHITGGGFVENVPRVLPDGAGARLDASRWPMPPVFTWLAQSGPVSGQEMIRTFNCGIGMIAIVAADKADRAMEALATVEGSVHRIGEITAWSPDSGPRVTVSALPFDDDAA